MIAMWPKDWVNDHTYIRCPNGHVTSCGGTTWLSDRHWLDEMRDPNSETNRLRDERMKNINQEAKEFREWRRRRQEVKASGVETDPKGAASE